MKSMKLKQNTKTITVIFIFIFIFILIFILIGIYSNKLNESFDVQAVSGFRMPPLFNFKNIFANKAIPAPAPVSQAVSQVGNYNYIGCWRDTGNRAIPNQGPNVSSLDQCSQYAEQNQQTIFGLQNGTTCFTGNDIDSAKKYGPADNCLGPLGGPWANQVYVRNSPFTIPNPYLNKNIRFTDGVICYVTNKGIVMQYPDTNTYSSTFNNNGCPSNTYTQIQPNFGQFKQGDTIPMTPQLVPPLVVGPPMQNSQNCNLLNDPNYYYNKNVQFNNGAICFIDTAGTARWYPNPNLFVYTAGKNGCPPLSWININVPFPYNENPLPVGRVISNNPLIVVGQNMYQGQSCSMLNGCQSIKLSPNELQCYQSRYSDLTGMNSQQLQNHWNNIGCPQQRNYSCPGVQTQSGNYVYQGCFNDNPNRAIPNQRQNVSSIDQCQNIAQQNGEQVFGLQYGGQCFTGSDLQKAKQYGQIYGNCGTLGGTWNNQVYYRQQPFPPPPPPVPQLSQANFNSV
jgi:hypothetical protein